MPSRDQFIRKLETLGFSYRGETKTSKKLRRADDVIYVPKKHRPDDDFVRSTLRRAGLTEEEIQAFLQHCDG